MQKQKENLSTSMAKLVMVVSLIAGIGAVMGVAGYYWMNKNKPAEVSQIKTDKEKLKEFVGAKQVILADKEVYEILKEFAIKQNAANISDNDILLNAIEFRDKGLKEQLEKIEYDLEEKAKFLQDAIDLRGFSSAKTKVCIAKGIIYNNLKQICDLDDSSFISTEYVDDILATEEVLPYFLVGISYFRDGDYVEANHYLNQIIQHRQTGINQWGESDFFRVSGKVYEKIFSKTMKILTEIETADWKTYKDKKMGIEFSYPKNWYFSSPEDWYVYFSEPEGKILLGKELAVSPYTGEKDPLYKIFKIISANSLEKALKFLKGKYDPSYYTVELQEKFNFQEKQAQKVLITCTSEYYAKQGIEAKEEIIVVILDDYTSFIIPLPNRNPEYAYPFTKKQSDIINQILSTFKFTEKDETADWKTYRNDEYGFEMKYPQDFYIEKGDYTMGDQYRKVWIQLADSKWKDQMIHNPSLIIDVIKTDLSPKQYLDKTGSSKSMLDDADPCPAKFIYCSVKDTNVGAGKLSALQFYSAAISGSDHHTIVENNGFLIDIRAHSSGLGDFSADIYNQILSTFKFKEKGETANRATGEEFLTSRDNFDYKLETFGDYPKQNIDQRLVKIDKTKKREVIISSIKEALPELKGRFNLLLSKFAIPLNSDKIFLKSVLIDTDNPGGIIYSCDLSTNEFKKLKINDIYNGFFGGFALSPDQTKFIWIPQSSENGDDKEMYLIDLARDEYKILIKLKNKETFNGGRGAMSSYQFVEWADNNKIRYAVYDQTKKSASYYDIDYRFKESIDKILIENRELTIKQ